MGSALWPIPGLDRRANPRLARMLVGLRKTLGGAATGQRRSVAVRCAARDSEGVAALTHAGTREATKERLAIALALRTEPHIRTGCQRTKSRFQTTVSENKTGTISHNDVRTPDK